MRAALVGAAIGAAAVVGLALATLTGWTSLGFHGRGIAIAAALGSPAVLLASDRKPHVIGVAAGLLVLLLLWPAAGLVYERAIADAQGHCADLARGTAGPPPLLARPGYSARYAFRFEARDGTYNCVFPDPIGLRTFWGGESVGVDRWVWEHLMD
jgi:hypothetical protein